MYNNEESYIFIFLNTEAEVQLYLSKPGVTHSKGVFNKERSKILGVRVPD